MLPDLNENGDLPPGIHPATWAEIESRFGKTTAARTRALATLRRLYDLALRTGSLKNFYIFGSFVSAVPDPRDVDVVVIMSADFRVESCPEESQTLFWHAEAQARHGASVFWLREGRLTDAAMREFLRAWQTRRDRTLRGILEVA